LNWWNWRRGKEKKKYGRRWPELGGGIGGCGGGGGDLKEEKEEGDGGVNIGVGDGGDRVLRGDGRSL